MPTTDDKAALGGDNLVAEKCCCTVCSAKKRCHICGEQTLLACSDCQINLAATVYVCGKKECRLAHDRVCSGERHPTTETDAAPEPMAEYIDIVFDGPPSHESGRFVEVENAAGKSISFGEWVKRPDGYWALRITALATLQAERDAAVAQERKRYERLAVSFGELQGLAQAVIDEVNKKLDHQHPPLKFTAPWAVLAKVQDCLLKNYGLRAAALKGDAKPATEEASVETVCGNSSKYGA